MFEGQLKARNELIEQMKREMLGPGSEAFCLDEENELISTRPDTRYCIGILFPQGNMMKMEEDDLQGEDVSDKEEISDDEEREENQSDDIEEKPSVSADAEYTMDDNVNMSTRLLPSSLGLTFISDRKLDKISIHVDFAIYKKAKVEDCKILVPDEVVSNFGVPEVFASYFQYDREKHILSLISNFDRKNIKYWYEADKADDGTFKPYAYKMLDFLQNGYVRIPQHHDVCISFSDNDYYNPQDKLGDTNAKICALRHKLKNNYYSYTIMLINDLVGKPSGANCIFQPQIHINTEKNSDIVFCDYSSLDEYSALDEEEMSNRLLYRNKKKYGAGLGTSVYWEIDDNGKGYLVNDFFPQVEVPPMEFKVAQKYKVSDNAFNMKYLSDLNDESKEEKIACLSEILNAYEKWIGELEISLKDLGDIYIKIAQKHIDNCKYCLDRMKRGINSLKDNSIAWDSFQLANRAMFMQRVQIGIQSKFADVYPDSEIADELDDVLVNTDYCKSEDKCEWRPFQIAFLLMCIYAMTDDSVDNADRNMVDLIWFPTGGGKTEAYLGLTAFTIFYRKLAHLDGSNGTSVIMRYTLRLLAAQQFTRAATLICACEYIRQESLKKRSKYKQYSLGEDEISIGLWIGGEHTPNTLKGAKECYEQLSGATVKNITNIKEKYNKFQILKCPWCGTKMVRDVSGKGKMIGRWGYNMPNKNKFYMSCPQESCYFESKLPMQVVDEELYKNPPTLLFATVDKFAMLPWYAETGNFFAVNSDNRCPELIIQDELHLISGPLGSMVGLYEAAVDYLCSHKGVKSKVIASTATICRAKEQCSALYNREVFQFPPQGLDESDSFFARSADLDERYGRRYVGLLPSGKTKAMMESRVIATLLQKAQEREDTDEIKDSYWTLTTYFNSLKELGKCSTIIQNDVRDNIRRMAHRNFDIKGRRNILRADELTSRVSTTQLNQTLDKLEKITYSSSHDNGEKYASNILLATNMISVGIDVERLNFMVMVGQPKLTSEYIQASSRVGRKYPGVVFTMYDSARSRDRSHYEQFKSYHESFYRYVEPTGVTPFSEPARKRALHAILISIIRHCYNLETNEDISKFNSSDMKDMLDSVSNFILERMDEINSRLPHEVRSESDQVKKEIDVIVEKLDILAESSHHKLEYGNIMGNKPSDECKRIMKPFGMSENEPITFDTMTSMRNVDLEVNVNIILMEE